MNFAEKTLRQNRISVYLQEHCPQQLKTLSKLLENEEAFIDGSLDILRDRLTRYADTRLPEAGELSWIEIEQAVEHAAENV
jgi:hypothetical protein